MKINLRSSKSLKRRNHRKHGLLLLSVLALAVYGVGGLISEVVRLSDELDKKPFVETVYATEYVSQIEYIYREVPLILDGLGNASLEDKQRGITLLLRHHNVSEEHINIIVNEIIPKESKWVFDNKAPFPWRKCDHAVQVQLFGYLQPPNIYVELKDYPDGSRQGTNCEEYGAVTLASGYTGGLTHILEDTRLGYECAEYGDFIGEIACVAKIVNTPGGICNWTYINSEECI